MVGAGQHLAEEKAGPGVARGELHGLAEEVDRPGKVIGRGRVGRLAQEAAQLPLLRLIEAGGVVLPERSETRLVARGGADHGGDARRFDFIEHGAEVGREIAGRRLAQRGVGGYDSLADHFLHQAPVFVRAAVKPAVQHLNEGQAPRGAHRTQGPRREGAGRVDRGRAVGAEEFVVAGVEDEQVGREAERIAHLIDEREAGHRGRAEVDHFDGFPRPGIGEHGLEEGGHREVARLRVALGRGLADEENTHGIRGLGQEEIGLLGVARAGRIGEEVGLGCRGFDHAKGRAGGQCPGFADPRRVAAPAEEAQDQLRCGKKKERQRDGDGDEKPTLGRRDREVGAGGFLGHEVEGTLGQKGAEANATGGLMVTGGYLMGRRPGTQPGAVGGHKVHRAAQRRSSTASATRHGGRPEDQKPRTGKNPDRGFCVGLGGKFNSARGDGRHNPPHPRHRG